jgi:HEPN domain-containing protein
MPRDLLREHVEAWLSRAVFHCQQAVEKALKGLLTAHEVAFSKAHDLGELSQPIVEAHPELEPLLREAAALSVYAWQYRYPGDPAEPSLDEATGALELASEAVAAVEGRLA